MSKYLDKSKELRARTDIHYNCNQGVVLPFAEELVKEAWSLLHAARTDTALFQYRIRRISRRGADNPLMLRVVACAVLIDESHFFSSGLIFIGSVGSW